MKDYDQYNVISGQKADGYFGKGNEGDMQTWDIPKGEEYGGEDQRKFLGDRKRARVATALKQHRPFGTDAVEEAAEDEEPIVTEPEVKDPETEEGETETPDPEAGEGETETPDPETEEGETETPDPEADEVV